MKIFKLIIINIMFMKVIIQIQFIFYILLLIFLFFYHFFMQHFIPILNPYYYQNNPIYYHLIPYNYQNAFSRPIYYIPQMNSLPLIDQNQQCEFMNSNYQMERQNKQQRTQETPEPIKNLSPVMKSEEMLQKTINDKKLNEVKIKSKIQEGNKQQTSSLHKNAYLSFIFNKIVKFIQNRRESQILVKCNFSKFNITDQAIIGQFYRYAQRESKKIVNQVSIQKVRDFWVNPNLQETLQFDTKNNIQIFHETFRVLSRIYLSEVYGKYILRSKKIKKERRIHHLRMRRCLLKNLKRPVEFKSYKDF